ncbi:opsin 8, group member b [Osmerus eperlanus]|uniref:opsin 8, group member b n=1 Tax=Osmerus eperlanus TaxID=29151 RepID=UPI002E1423B3
MDIYSSKLSPAVDIGAGIFLFIIAVLSFVGNLLVLIMAFRRSSSMKPPEMLSVNLAVTDLGAAVTMYPLAVASAWNHHWLGSDASCVYYAFMGFFFGTASAMTLTVMAMVRFMVSLSLQSPKEKISQRNVKLLCLWCWLYALLWALLPLLGWGKYGPEPFGLSCTLSWLEMKAQGFSFIIAIFICNLLLPSIVITGCYSVIALKLYITYKSINNINQVPNIVKMNRRLMLIAVLISAGFIGCWTPYGVVNLWSVFNNGSSISPGLSMLPCLFAKTSTVYNPFIYYTFSKSFKKEVKQLCFTSVCAAVCGRYNACNVSQGHVTHGVYTGCEMSKVPDESIRMCTRDTRHIPELHELSAATVSPLA